jgi:hypothetical protein
VSYRKKGQRAWKQAMDLFRTNNERVLSNVRFDVISPNMFTGSVLDLDPGTDYEVQFVMTDPDGVSGQARVWRPLRTRPSRCLPGGPHFPRVSAHWTAPGLSRLPRPDGRVQQLNVGHGHDHGHPSARARRRHDPRPRRVVQVPREFYTNDLTLQGASTFDGTYYLTGKGEPDKPISIKAAAMAR